MSLPLDIRQQDPDGSEIYTIDWNRFPGAGSTAGSGYLKAGETISSSLFTVTGMVIDSQSNDTTTSTVKLSGGTDNTDYDVKCHIVTSLGRATDRTIRIQVRQQ